MLAVDMGTVAIFVKRRLSHERARRATGRRDAAHWTKNAFAAIKLLAA
ncbi:MAG: hypothetical protein Q8Q62_15800 [Mesorhizobium sp.]|nr:hypothetical protein [Mesorhizobium sp.]